MLLRLDYVARIVVDVDVKRNKCSYKRFANELLFVLF